MKVLITGGAGEVGRNLVRDLSRQGYEVTVMDRVTKPEIEQYRSITYLQGNLADAAFVNEGIQGMDVVIHLAWGFADDPATIFGEDIKGHVNLLEAASSTGVHHLIYTSTATVYGRAVLHPVTETHFCLLGDARKPLYALGKFTAEELCRFYSKERGLASTIFRFWWAFGDNIGGRHLRDLIKKSLENQPLEMVCGAGGAFVTMADLGSAMVLAIKKPAAMTQVYNVGSLFLTWEEIGAMIVQLTRSTSALQLISSDQWRGPAFLNEVWDLSWEKAERELGFRPTDSVDKARSQFIEALRSCVGQVKQGE